MRATVAAAVVALGIATAAAAALIVLANSGRPGANRLASRPEWRHAVPLAIALALVATAMAPMAFILVRSGRERFASPAATTTAVPGKTIWLLWLQGWDEAPHAARIVRRTWELHNPGWNVEAVSEATLSRYLTSPPVLSDAMSPAAKSGLVRLHLLAEHGGVWADATLPCMQPLESWIYDAVEPSGVWMYHGGTEHGGDDQAPSSWFIVSLRENYIVRRWADACAEPGAQVQDGRPWLDGLFFELLDADPRFAAEWSRVPRIWSGDEGQALMLASMSARDAPDARTMDVLLRRPPFVLKLNRPRSETTAGTRVLQIALERVGMEPVPHAFRTPRAGADSKNDFLAGVSKVMVGADCKNGREGHAMKDLCDSRGIFLVMYDKCDFCKHVPDGVYCRPLRNVGREQGTFVHFALRHYDALPDEIFFLPANIWKDYPGFGNRFDRMVSLMDDDDRDATGCDGGSADPDFQYDEHEGVPLVPADIRPFGAWFSANVAEFGTVQTGPCWNGLMRTSRRRIHRHSVEFYEGLMRQLAVDANTELAHYMERSMGAVF